MPSMTPLLPLFCGSQRESGETLSGSVFKSRPHTSGQLRTGRILIAHSQVKDT